MKLDRLRMIRQELKNEFRHDDVTPEVYYLFNRKWNRLDDVGPVAEGIVTCLDKAAGEIIAYHSPSSRSAWFACPAMTCTVSIEFTTSPRASTRKQYRERLEQVLTRASNAYKVAHHPLTQLLAKDAFGEQLRAAILDLKGDTQSSAGVEDVKQQQLLAVFALDIDHFKQVNDSHGHLYGDQVLRTFGMRLEQASAEWKAAGHGAITVSLGHPSGEEFLVLVLGRTTKEQTVDLGNIFRKRIDREPLPSETEWTWLKERGNLSMLVPPPLHERTVTTSIGIAVYAPSVSDESPQDQASRLLDQADTALYRAKAGGRNQVIVFDDILSNCGRVLEQDIGTRIVAIDIGKNVGVTLGQEFRVFPPGFTGMRKFQVSDGRSTRTIGAYPRFNLTRITVFDVQPEVSFAFVSDPADGTLPIDVGSHLEAVPLGSIGHLLPHAAKYLSPGMDGVRIGNIDNVVAFIEENSAANPKPYAVVLRFMRAEQYLKRYGTAALNAALARLFRDATTTFHAAAATGVLDSTSIVFVGRDSTYDKKRLEAFVDRLGSELPELGVLGGVFCNADIPKKAAGRGDLSAKHAIEFARFAASDHALTSQARLTHFSYEAAFRILTAQRESRQFVQAQADFEKLRSLGVESASLYNLGGLSLWGQRKNEQAAEMFETAASLDGTVIMFKSNFATSATTPGQIDRAMRLLAGTKDADIDALKQGHPLGYFSYTKLLAQARVEGLPTFNQARFVRMAPLVLDLREFDDEPGRELIETALASL